VQRLFRVHGAIHAKLQRKREALAALTKEIADLERELRQAETNYDTAERQFDEETNMGGY
jgi:predicted  nucleic acid-binding Zn-ribbon protein